MSLAIFFQELKNRGIKLQLGEQGSVKVIGRRDQLDQQILRELKENKNEVAKWLAKEQMVELKTGIALLPSLFLVHPIGGYAHCYVELATHLNYGGTVFGVQMKGDMPDTIEKMAAKYISVITLVQPGAPYLLGGWSMGGVVAYEMARQLTAAREEVELLFMIDSFHPDMMKENSSLDHPTAHKMSLLATMASELGITDESLGPAEKAALSQMELEDMFLLFLQLGTEQNRLPPGFGLSELKERFAVMLNNSSAVRRYKASPIPGEIHLVRAEENKTPDATLGWGSLVTRVFVTEQQGNHFSIMRRPHVLELAKKMDAAIPVTSGTPLVSS